MIDYQVKEYSSNVLVSALIAFLLFGLFYLFFGNTIAIWSAIAVIGMPHFIFATVGYLASNPKKFLLQFELAFFFGLFLAFIYYTKIPNALAPFIFLAYFMWHLLINEQMFESTIATGYEKWQNKWPIVISWGSIALVIASLGIAAYYQIGINNLYLLYGLWTLIFVLFFSIALSILRSQNQNKVPWGFLFIFIVLLVPAILLFIRVWQGVAYAPPVFLALFHFVSWYVFYTKRLRKYPRTIQEFGFKKLIYSWKNSARMFWLYILILQSIWLIFLLIYLYYPNQSLKSATSYLVSPQWAPFWTIIHVTTSFLPPRQIAFRFAFGKAYKIFEKSELARNS